MSRGFRDEHDDDEPVTIDEVVSHRNTTSGLALVCTIDGREVLVPHSQITDDSEVYEPGQSGKLVITAWLARREGLS